MIFSKFFRSKKRDRYKRDNYEEELARTRYADIATENIVHEINLPDEAASRHYVVDLCEQMIDASKELEDIRSEYQVVTDYLNDIQAIEDMPPEQKEPIVDCATHVARLDKERAQFLKTERKLSETQFAQMQEEEEELPGIINRLKANETYLDAIKKDLSYLGGEKLEWEMLKADSINRQKILRRMSWYLLVIYATLMVLYALAAWFGDAGTQIPMMVSTAMAAVLGVYILVKYQDSSRDIKRSDVNRNHAISVENHVKIKYVNIKNAVDYTCEKYHARNSKELSHVYEQYQEEVRQNEKFRKTNDDLEYYNDKLVELLRQERLYDPKVWMNHSNAIIDSREMVELKHDLITRRQKLRAQMEYQMNMISDMKKEVLRHMNRLGADAPQIQAIIHKIEEILNYS